MKRKVALITGITGQDGSYLAELLLDKGYEVNGIIRRSSSFNTGRVDHIYKYNDPIFKLHYGDLTDSLVLDNLMKKIVPDEIYHLGAQSHVKVSFELPDYTAQVDAIGTLRLLESMKNHAPHAKFYNAATSELYGQVKDAPQNESTEFNPRSPYGVAKLYSYWTCKVYRDAYNLYICNGILFNHESERRGHTFVTKKITEGLANWYLKNEPIYLGNLDAKRDWGYAKDYVYGMYLMMQMPYPDDYVLATNESHSIREFINEAITYLPNYSPDQFKWVGEGKNEKLIFLMNNESVIEVAEKYFRPAEVDALQGDYFKAKCALGWEPTIRFHELVKIMMQNDLEKIPKMI